jgi:hypothetical protein
MAQTTQTYINMHTLTTSPRRNIQTAMKTDDFIAKPLSTNRLFKSGDVIDKEKDSQRRTKSGASATGVADVEAEAMVCNTF